MQTVYFFQHSLQKFDEREHFFSVCTEENTSSIDEPISFIKVTSEDLPTEIAEQVFGPIGVNASSDVPIEITFVSANLYSILCHRFIGCFFSLFNKLKAVNVKI